MESSAEDVQVQEPVAAMKAAMVKSAVESVQATAEPVVGPEPVLVNGTLGEEDMDHFPALAEGNTSDFPGKDSLDDAIIAAAAAAEADLPPVPAPAPVEMAKTSTQDEKPVAPVVVKPKPKRAAKKPKTASESTENGSSVVKTVPNNATPTVVTDTKPKRQRKRKSDPDFIEDPRHCKTVNGEVISTVRKTDPDAPPKPKKNKVAAKKEPVVNKPKDNKNARKSPSKSIVAEAKDAKNATAKKKEKVTIKKATVKKPVQKTEKKDQTVEKSSQKEQEPAKMDMGDKKETAKEQPSSAENVKDAASVMAETKDPHIAMEVDSDNKKEVENKNKVTDEKVPVKNKVTKPKDPSAPKKAPAKRKEKTDDKSTEKKEKPVKKKKVSKDVASDGQTVAPTVPATENKTPESCTQTKDTVTTVPTDNNKTNDQPTVASVQEKPKRKYAKKKNKEEDAAAKTQGDTTKTQGDSTAIKQGDAPTKPPGDPAAKPKAGKGSGKSGDDSAVTKSPPKRKPAAKKKPKVASTDGSANAEQKVADPSSASAPAVTVENSVKPSAEPAGDGETVPNKLEQEKEGVITKEEGVDTVQLQPQPQPAESTSITTTPSSVEQPKKPKKKRKPKPPADSTKADKSPTGSVKADISASNETKTDNAKDPSAADTANIAAPPTDSVTVTATATEEPKEDSEHASVQATESKEDGATTDAELCKFPCTQCSYRGKNKASLLKHLKNHHGIFQCSHCEFTSTTKDDMDEHMKNHPSSKWGKRKCPKCIRFINPSEFEEHEKTCTGKPDPIICPHCQKEFRFKALFESHLKTHLPGTKPPAVSKPNAAIGVKKCQKCGRRYSKEDMETHSNACDGTPVPFVCPECKKEFRFMTKLKNHMKIHLKHEDMEFSCDICDYKTPFFGYLEKHMGTMHTPDREKTVPCPDCSKLFYTEANMRMHVKYSCITTDQQTCDVCGKTVKSADALRRHKVTHEEEKNVICDLGDCKMAFKTKRLLTYHKKSVHGQLTKKFRCTHENCEETFLKKSQLTRHESAHDGDRKYKCTWDGCGKAFRHPDNLKVHTLQHTDEKPIKCELCEYRCRQRSSIQHHMRTKHPNAPQPARAKSEDRGSNASRGKRDSDMGGSQSDTSSCCKDIYAFDGEEDGMTPLPPLQKGVSRSPRPKSLLETPIAATPHTNLTISPPGEDTPKPKVSRPKKKKKSEPKPAADTDKDQDNSDKPPPKKKKKPAANPEKKTEPTKSKKKSKAKQAQEPKPQEVNTEIPQEVPPPPPSPPPPPLPPQEQAPTETAMSEPINTDENNELMAVSEAAEHSLETSLNTSGPTTDELVPQPPAPPSPDPYQLPDGHLDDHEHTVHDDELPADFDPEKHMAEAFGSEAAYDIANEMAPVDDDPSRSLDQMHSEPGDVPGQNLPAYPPTTVGETADFPQLHAITEPVTGEALVEKMKEDFSEEQLEQLAKETQEELNAVMSGHDGLNNMGGHGDDNFPTGVEVPVITSHHQGAPHSVEYSAPSSNLPPPSHEAPSSIPPPSNEAVQSQEPPGYPMSHDSQQPFSAFTGEPTSEGSVPASVGNNGHPVTTDPAVSESSLPPYSSAVPYTAPFPHLSPTTSAGAADHNTALSSSYSAPLSSPYLSPTYPMPLPSSLPGYDSASASYTSTQPPAATTRSQEALNPNTEAQSGVPSSRSPDSLYSSSGRSVTATTTFPTDTFSRELFGQYFPADPTASMPLTHPPMSQDPQRPSYLPQQQPGFPMLPRTNTDLLRRGPMMPGSGYSSMAESLINPAAAALTQQHGQQSWGIGHEERSRTWGQPSPIIMGPPPPELGTGSPLATTRNPYSERPEYSFDPNTSSQLGRRPGETPSFPVPQTLANPTQHYDMASAYMTARSLNPSAQDSSYSRAMGSATTNSQNRFEDAYRHMADYRTLPQPPSMADMYGRMGMNPALGLDKYYYPTRDAMYRSQHIASTTNPFLPQTSTAAAAAQMGYTDREYSRNASMYTQHSAYGFMAGDKQFLPSSKITPGVPTAADYFPGRPGATDPHTDPYRRIYNMMSRYY